MWPAPRFSYLAEWARDIGEPTTGLHFNEGTPSDLVAARSTLTRQHLARCVCA